MTIWELELLELLLPPSVCFVSECPVPVDSGVIEVDTVASGVLDDVVEPVGLVVEVEVDVDAVFGSVTGVGFAVVELELDSPDVPLAWTA